VKTNAQRREVARLRLQAALLQQEADELRRQARRQARQGMTPGKVVAAFVAWVGIALGIVIGVSGPHHAAHCTATADQAAGDGSACQQTASADDYWADDRMTP
jgi:hypothetical protein